MFAMILGGSLIYLAALVLAALAFAIMWIVILIRVAISSRSAVQKVLWILGIILFAPIALIYALTDKSKFWRIYAVITLLLFLPPIALTVMGAQKSQLSMSTPAGTVTSAMGGSEQPAQPAPVQAPATPAQPAAAATGTVASTPLMEYMDGLAKRLQALSNAHAGTMEALPFMQAADRVTTWRTQIAAQQITEQQVRPLIVSLVHAVADDKFSDAEMDQWGKEVMAAGMNK